MPLSKLRTSEVVRAVVDHPRRLEELVGLLEDRDVVVRGRAATTLVRLADSHPARLLRTVERLKAGLTDESAFVRWHLVYVLGRLGWNFPARAGSFVPQLADCLDDANGVVRSLAYGALAELAHLRPDAIEGVLSTKSGAVSPVLAQILKSAAPSPAARKRPRR